MQMWLCEDKLKGKTAHFRLPSASQKHACFKTDEIRSRCSLLFLPEHYPFLQHKITLLKAFFTGKTQTLIGIQSRFINVNWFLINWAQFHLFRVTVSVSFINFDFFKFFYTQFVVIRF